MLKHGLRSLENSLPLLFLGDLAYAKEFYRYGQCKFLRVITVTLVERELLGLLSLSPPQTPDDRVMSPRLRRNELPMRGQFCLHLGIAEALLESSFLLKCYKLITSYRLGAPECLTR